jgi:phosphomevalonate kinase
MKQMHLSCSFQHCQSGMHISALYKRKKLILEMMDTLEDMQPYIENDDVYHETAEWVANHTGKRFETIDDAVEYLRKAGIDDYLEFDC